MSNRNSTGQRQQKTNHRQVVKKLVSRVKVDKPKMNRSVDKNIDELLSRLESTSISGKKKISQARSSRRSIKRGRR